MTKFILVHGAWHDSRFWSGVAEDLRARDHEVVAVDLPGRGNTPARPGLLRGWRTGLKDSVATVLKAMGPGAEQVVLAGHSMGGLTITQVGEDAAERIKSLVYVAAMLPMNGEGAMQLRRLMMDSPVNRISRLNMLTGALTLKQEESIAVFYNECSQIDIDYSHECTTQELIGPSLAKVRTTPERWGKLNKLYIQCSKDKAIPPATQQAMCERAGVNRISVLNADHSPNFSMRSELVELLAAEA